MRVFLTGGAGFVGRQLIGALRDHGDTAESLAISPAEADVVARVGARPWIGDVHDVDLLRRGMQGCEVVYHLAATVGMWGRFQDFYHINVEGTRCVLEAAQAAGVPRLVYVSAAAVLSGSRQMIDADETWPIPRRPLGVYARSKALAEKLVLAANRESFATVAVRPPAIWGSGGSSLVTSVIERVKQGKFFWIDHGRYPYVTCHVRNVCEGLMLATERGRGGEAYFLTDGPAGPFREFVSDVLRTQGLEPGDRSISRRLAWAAAWACESAWRIFRFKRNPPITRTLVRLVGSPLTVRDAKARQELGYQARFTRDAGMTEMVVSCNVDSF